MIAIDSFTKIGDYFYIFSYNLGDIGYNSGIYFPQPCTKEYFKNFFPVIKDTLQWFENNINSIKTQVGLNLPSDMDIKLFETLHIVSFSLSFDTNQESSPTMNIAYGESEYDIYILVSVKEKQVYEVKLNL